MENKTNPWTIVLAVVITAVVVGGGVYYWQTQKSTEVLSEDVTSTKTAKPEFGSLLTEKKNNNLPFGTAEIEGYYTNVQRATSLDNSTPDVTCSAFVITDGPSLLLNALK